MTRPILMMGCIVGLSGCQQLRIETGKPCAEVESAIRQYYEDKYPAFAELTALGAKPLHLPHDLRESGDLRRISPVSEMIHSYPHGPYISFLERMERSEHTVSVLHVDLHASENQTCRVVFRVKTATRDGLPFATGEPSPDDSIREIRARIGPLSRGGVGF